MKIDRNIRMKKLITLRRLYNKSRWDHKPLYFHLPHITADGFFALPETKMKVHAQKALNIEHIISRINEHNQTLNQITKEYIEVLASDDSLLNNYFASRKIYITSTGVQFDAPYTRANSNVVVRKDIWEEVVWAQKFTTISRLQKLTKRYEKMFKLLDIYYCMHRMIIDFAARIAQHNNDTVIGLKLDDQTLYFTQTIIHGTKIRVDDLHIHFPFIYDILAPYQLTPDTYTTKKKRGK